MLQQTPDLMFVLMDPDCYHRAYVMIRQVPQKELQIGRNV